MEWKALCQIIDINNKVQAQILILEILNVWMPVPLYLSGVIKIVAFPRPQSGIFDLNMKRISSFRWDNK